MNDGTVKIVNVDFMLNSKCTTAYPTEGKLRDLEETIEDEEVVN